MKQFLCAAVLALALLAAAEQKASAWGCCGGGGLGHLCPFGGGCGGGGRNPLCPSGRGCGGGRLGSLFPCLGIVPGPWYTYWPDGGIPAQGGDWRYWMHFQTPAPIGESFCSDYGGYYPGYWYGQ